MSGLQTQKITPRQWREDRAALRREAQDDANRFGVDVEIYVGDRLVFQTSPVTA